MNSDIYPTNHYQTLYICDENNKYTYFINNGQNYKINHQTEKNINTSNPNIIFNIDNNIDSNVYISGIKNYWNNCYFNSGLQILVSCEKFVKEIESYNSSHNDLQLTSLVYDAIKKLLNGINYNPLELLKYFVKLNNNVFGVQSCSQNFIRTLLRNLNNEFLIYEKRNFKIEGYNPSNKENESFINFLHLNKLYQESSLLSIFSGISKNYSKERCNICGFLIEEYSYYYFIDQNIYLDGIYSKCNFSDILKKNFGQNNNLTMNCPRCKNEIIIKENSKFIKLPEVFIFTLERFQAGNNNVEIIPDDFIYMDEYIDQSLKGIKTKYELFAINIRLGETKNFGHEKCQVKRNEIWLEFDDETSDVKQKSYNKDSYGLFYKRL